MNENKTSRYLKYAIGEITLVVIGILIALWLNNLNTEYQLENEKNDLIIKLRSELYENLEQFKDRRARLIKTNENLIKVLNASAGYNKDISRDSIVTYLNDKLIFGAANINNSRLNSAKSSGKFTLLTDEISTALTAYETALENYKSVINVVAKRFNQDWSEYMIRFKAQKRIGQSLYPDSELRTHPGFEMNDAEFMSFIEDPDTYQVFYNYYTDSNLEILWTEDLIYRIENILNTFEAEKKVEFVDQ